MSSANALARACSSCFGISVFFDAIRHHASIIFPFHSLLLCIDCVQIFVFHVLCPFFAVDLHTHCEAFILVIIAFFFVIVVLLEDFLEDFLSLTVDDIRIIRLMFGCFLC